MPKTAKAKKKVSKPKTKVVSKTKKTTTKVVSKGLVKISKTYIPKDTEKYMCEKHKVYFRMRLTEWKKKPLLKKNIFLTLRKNICVLNIKNFLPMSY